MNSEWKYKIILETPDWPEIQDWCEINIGEFDKDWYKLGIDPAEYFIFGRTKTTWFFKQESHAINFSLRWV